MTLRAEKQFERTVEPQFKLRHPIQQVIVWETLHSQPVSHLFQGCLETVQIGRHFYSSLSQRCRKERCWFIIFPIPLSRDHLPPGSRENSGLCQKISGRFHLAKGLLIDPQHDSALTQPGRDSDSYPPCPCL